MTTRTTTQAFYDVQTGTVSYVVSDDTSGHAAIIDPVLDYDFRSGHTSTMAADRIKAYIAERGLTVDWILETHAHADHLSAAQYLKSALGGRIAIGEHIREVQTVFKQLFNLERSFLPDGSQFDYLLKDGETFAIGNIKATVWYVPGHTPADCAYLIEDEVFVGDTLFMPDVGTARADFPGGDARTLYRSIHRLLGLPPETRLHVCHDYPPDSRAPQWITSVGAQRRENIHVRDGITEDQFVAMRTQRDAGLDVPTLILQSLQVNVRAGQMPPAEDNGVSYLKIPLNALPRSRVPDRA